MGNDGVAQSGSIRRGTTALVGAALAMLMLVGCTAAGRGAAEAEAPAVAADAAGEADRSVVIEGSMHVAVDDVSAAADRALGIVEAAGGRVEGRDERSGGERLQRATIELRIPSASLNRVLDDLGALGTVGSLRTSTLDVTVAVQDVDARIAAVESTLTRLRGFQDAAASVSDLLAIEREISDRQAELEQLRAAQADYADRTEYSAISLTLESTRPPAAVPDSFWGGLVAGWNALGMFASWLLVVVGVLAPWLAAAGIVAAAILALVRILRRRRFGRRRDLP